MNAATVFSNPAFEQVLNALATARDQEQSPAMAIAYESLMMEIISRMYEIRVADLEGVTA